ncbi:60S ribosomal export protein [Phytophthora fragariae]|uniref:60S ribosomal export protein NMD3 n=1 Tax=Phytophthora fragariae TaxID=53985 RepID=A0A6A3QDC8_9STRA|nr:60S ribosomal export protein [Phytophthora fragariae]KAE8923368.1 60S ribosomal export protein [Phytophthora fragariae]KAE9073178.1 60S ribosomal export protein [Phytophthora fragariae]KAE9073685.1 60S ribosomal export protein [Phytophthora fragariae]KAE9085963.1 60S ribosomal export protein [Phytophthora fragariae]
MAISCCMCGAQIEANAMNMCASCIASEVDVAEGIDTTCDLVQCRGCLRFQSRGKGQHFSSAGGAWLGCDLESKELMALCLKSIPGLSKAKLIDAGFIWTEPHSKRVKLRLTLQREVANHAVVQNSCVVTFVIQSVKCPDCTKQYHNNTWRALVQIRQKAEHKRTFLRLEQEILKHSAHQDAIGITAVKEGMDFYFGTKSTAERFIHFLSAHVPMRSKSSSKLISENVHNATANLQLTYSVELSPICKDDLLVLPRKFAQSCGNISDVTLCARTTSTVHLLDPVSGQKAELSTDRYWKLPFLPLATSSEMVEFIVLDVEPVDPRNLRNVGPAPTSGRGGKSKYVVADVEVARASDFGVNDMTFQIRTHLGGVLTAGDTVKGYDLSSAVFGTSQTYSLKNELPDIVLVRKVYPRESGKRHTGDRKLKTLGASRRGKVSKAETARLQHEMEVFTEEYLEEKEQEEHEGVDEDEGEDEEDEEEEGGHTEETDASGSVEEQTAAMAQLNLP